MEYPTKRTIWIALVYVFLSASVFIALFPYFWMILTSLKVRQDAFAIPPVWIFKPTLKHYVQSFIERGFLRNLGNSIFISFSVTFLSLAIGLPSAYAFVRYKLFGDHHIFFYILTTRMAPPVTIALPLYLLMRNYGLLDTQYAVIIAHLTFNLSLVVWIMQGFFKLIPTTIEEAAKLDGCSGLGVFFRVSLPLAKKGIVATAIFCLIFSWNEFLYVYTLGGEGAATLTAAIPSLVTTRGTFWGEIGAVGTVVTLPVVIFTFFVLDHLVRGLSFGTVE